MQSVNSSDKILSKILVVLNGKGGVGKTTTTINIAAMLAEKARVLLVDTDPQGSATWWVEQSGKSMDFDLSKETNPELLRNLRTISGYKLIVIDTAPALSSKSLAAVVAIADYLILPTPPAPMDLIALINTVKTVVAPSAIAHRVLLTKVNPRGASEAKDALATLSELEIPAFKTFIRAYKAHEKATLDGVPISQWRGRNAREAEADYRSVIKEILEDWRNV